MTTVLRGAFQNVRQRYPFSLDAAVVLPDHLHCVWTLPPGDGDFATRWRLIKTWFTKHSGLALSPIWQPRYWEHVVRDQEDFARHVDYIHYNPVKHGYVTSPVDWPYSSIRRYVEQGIYPVDWGKQEMEFVGVGKE